MNASTVDSRGLRVPTLLAVVVLVAGALLGTSRLAGQHRWLR